MLVSAKDMLLKAERKKCAVGQFNVNNLEWARAILGGAKKMNAPVILGVTESAAAYMGGLRTVAAMIGALLAYERPHIPVCLHLDHAGFEMCLEAIGAGFTSVMFDGSKLPFAENMAICQRLAEVCAKRGVSLEAELGSPTGEEDGISGSGERADPGQCAELAGTGITALAAAVGNIHGEYPPDWTGLDFGLLEWIHSATGGLPLVLHGGTGIPETEIREAIALGICKINVNTECQIVFANALSRYFSSGLDGKPKGYNPQKIFMGGIKAIEAKVCEKIQLFGVAGLG